MDFEFLTSWKVWILVAIVSISVGVVGWMYMKKRKEVFEPLITETVGPIDTKENTSDSNDTVHEEAVENQIVAQPDVESDTAAPIESTSAMGEIEDTTQGSPYVN